MKNNILTNEELKEDRELNIRPSNLEEYIGQCEVKENIEVFIKSSLLNPLALLILSLNFFKARGIRPIVINTPITSTKYCTSFDSIIPFPVKTPVSKKTTVIITTNNKTTNRRCCFKRTFLFSITLKYFTGKRGTIHN